MLLDRARCDTTEPSTSNYSSSRYHNATHAADSPPATLTSLMDSAMSFRSSLFKFSLPRRCCRVFLHDCHGVSLTQASNLMKEEWICRKADRPGKELLFAVEGKCCGLAFRRRLTAARDTLSVALKLGRQEQT